ncbi:family 20 glycosylhydrolase [Phycicoccus sonneratiae]|uniref:Family 20 glycosylhydrolase n=1 Tax=Phycicoccus sonneratiae TaxID=2807628 RepID=A0ABS2CJF8_9MICO|nr:family 20 glycosylhydrolase [Phycicoccus sonneraticus]MBM6400026.1 family 20 glycosylhydrolase [Phycicoccus sonneraticus]
MATTTLCLAGALAVPAAGAAPRGADAAPPLPPTIPALSSWTPAEGTWSLPSRARVVTSPQDARALSGTASLLARELRSVTHRAVSVAVLPPSRAREGDIVLDVKGRADGDSVAGQTHDLTVGRTLTVSARGEEGVFLGTRTVVQLLRQSTTLPRGSAHDTPAVAERSVMVDVARTYMSPAWLEDLVRQMSYLKYTHLHLHLTDDQAWRLPSRSHPEVVSEQHYTWAELRRLLALADRYHVTVVPEVNMPGHAQQIIDAHPELTLRDAAGTVRAGSIDLSQPAAWRIARDLYTEYARFFPGREFHLGADEWLTEREIGRYPQLQAEAQRRIGPDARARDLLYRFVNTAAATVRREGKTARMWNDQLVTGYVEAVDPRIVIDSWYDGSEFGWTPQTLAEAGHDLVNSAWTSLYYIQGITRTDPARIYEQVTPTTFDGGQTLTGAALERLRGLQFSVWGDLDPDAETENQVAYGIARPLRATAQVAWGSPRPTASWDDFLPVVRAVGDAPGFDTPLEPYDDVPVVTVSAAVDPLHPAEDAADRRLGTVLRTAGPAAEGTSVTLDLRTARKVVAVDLRTDPPGEAPAPLPCARLEASADGTTWRTVATLSGASEAHPLVTGPDPVRYVRLVTTCASPDPLRIAEIGIAVEQSSAPGLSSSLPVYDVYDLARAGDGDPSTFFWGGRGAQLDDYVLRDLGSVRDLAGVDVLMGDPPARDTDYLHEVLLEVSPDGSTWTELGRYRDTPEIHADAPAGTTARYLRLRSLAAQGSWTILRELAAR